MSNALPRPEYPRPQFRRDEWLCLNGPWQFEIDAGDSGEKRGMVERDLGGEITVPFCPESELSGVGNTDFLNAVWYRRTIDVPAEWAGRRVLLHFQAVDYDATVWVDGRKACWHRGGWAPFQVDLGDVGGKRVTIVVRAQDDHRIPKAVGKQSNRYENYGCHYTRTTGIWQTVWMEPVAKVALARPRITPDVGRRAFRLELPLDLGAPRPSVQNLRVRATVRDAAGVITKAEASVADLAPSLDLQIPEDRTRLWSPEDPFLYDLDLELLSADGTPQDRLAAYAGLRAVQLDGARVLINGKSVFQRLVLDQGYYPDGIMTAPSDEALKRDIELSIEAGFNGARLHQKVFEERFLYHADCLGYLCWGEYGDWRMTDDTWFEDELAEWADVMTRDRSHPSIIGWCPLNEIQRQMFDPATQRRGGMMRAMYAVTKAVDPSRPALDVSGGYHCVQEADVIDTHDYDQDPEALTATYARLCESEIGHWWANPRFEPPPIDGRPFFVSEFGGTWWAADTGADGKNQTVSWGYGQPPQSAEECLGRIEALCTALLRTPCMFGYCYTQLTDVYQEQNGVYTFDRKPKFDMQHLRKAQRQKAAIEESA